MRVFSCLYTKHKEKKRKTWSDGILRISISGFCELYNSSNPEKLHLDKPLDSIVVAQSVAKSIASGQVSEIEFEGFLCTIEEPLDKSKQSQITPVLTSSSKLPVMKKFKPPSQSIPSPKRELEQGFEPWQRRDQPLPNTDPTLLNSKVVTQINSPRGKYSVDEGELDSIWNISSKQETQSPPPQRHPSNSTDDHSSPKIDGKNRIKSERNHFYERQEKEDGLDRYPSSLSPSPSPSQQPRQEHLHQIQRQHHPHPSSHSHSFHPTHRHPHTHEEEREEEEGEERYENDYEEKENGEDEGEAKESWEEEEEEEEGGEYGSGGDISGWTHSTQVLSSSHPSSHIPSYPSGLPSPSSFSSSASSRFRVETEEGDPDLDEQDQEDEEEAQQEEGRTKETIHFHHPTNQFQQHSETSNSHLPSKDEDVWGFF